MAVQKSHRSKGKISLRKNFKKITFNFKLASKKNFKKSQNGFLKIFL